MSVEETQVIVEGFLDDHAGTWLAEDAELYDPDWLRTRGRPAVTAWLARWSQVRPPRGWLVVGDGRAAAELALGCATEPLVNAVAIFEVQAGEIVRIGLYYATVTQQRSARETHASCP